MIESAGLTPAELADPDAEIPYIAGGRLLARCVKSTGCRHFGLLVGERAGPSSLGVAGFILQSAPDVRHALHGLVQHFDLHDQGGAPTLRVEDASTILGYAIHQSGVEAADQIYDLTMAVGCNIMRGLCGESWNATEVLLSRRQPHDLAPYRRFFRAPLRFNADQSAVVFATRWLDHRISNADPLLHRHLEKEATELHALRRASALGDLRRLLRKSLVSGKCTVADVARQLCMHERTLCRRLQAEGSSFRRELDDIRYEMAKQSLAESTMPIAKIATMLCYADVSAFSRAFKRWTGVTPAQWRDRTASSCP